VADLLGVAHEEIIFVSCGTEADNLALLGTGPVAPQTGRLITTTVEHPAVEEPAKVLAQRGWDVQRLVVGPSGAVDLDAAAEPLSRAADVMSVILAQNETGVLQPVAELASAARAVNPEIIVHTDAAQAVGKIEVEPRALGVDLLTVVGHKLYAPKGIGALWIRPGVDVRPLTFGGGQEGGLRSGTESVPLIVGLGEACALASEDLAQEAARQAALRDRLWDGLSRGVEGLVRTAAGATFLPSHLHVCFPRAEGAAVLAAASEVAASTGSACHTADGSPAGILVAMGMATEIARGAVRLSLGRSTSEDQVAVVSSALVDAWRRVRA
jgi:cysteine desulfurase